MTKWQQLRKNTFNRNSGKKKWEGDCPPVYADRTAMFLEGIIFKSPFRYITIPLWTILKKPG